MLESIATKILSSYLGEYIEGLDSDNLDVKIYSGDTTLNNLTLKKTALQELKMPITLRDGFLRSLKLNIPWRNLGSEPVIATIEGLYLIVTPKPKSSSSFEEEEKRKQDAKVRRLKLAELIGSDRKSIGKKEPGKKDKKEKKEKKKSSGFFKKIRSKIVNNLQIFINKIHIRFEDDQSNSRQPYAAGFIIEHFHAQSTDGDWRPTFLKLAEEISYKLIDLKNLAVYWDNHLDKESVRMKYKDQKQMASMMDDHVFSEPGASARHYIVQPISGKLRATMDRNKEIKMDTPKTLLDLEVETIELGLNRLQFSSLMDLIEYLSKYSKNFKFLQYRPADGVVPSSNPKAWWRYAISCVKTITRDNKQHWSWEYMKGRKIDRQRYIELFRQKKLGKQKLKSAEVKELTDLEFKHSYHDLLLWRRLAHASIDLAKQKKKANKDAAKTESREKRKAMLSKLLVSSSKKKKQQQADKATAALATEDDLSDLSDLSSMSESDDLDKSESTKAKDKDKKKDKAKEKELKKLEKAKEKQRKKKEKEEKKLADKAKKSGDKSERSERIDKASASSSSASASPASFSSRVKDFNDELEQSSDSVAQKDKADQDANEALKELYKAIDYDDNVDTDDKPKKTYPPEYVKLQFNFRMKKGSFKLLDSLTEESKLLDIDFNRVVVSFGLRSAGSFSVVAKLKTIKARDYFSLGSATPLSIIEPDVTQIKGNTWRIVSVQFDKKPPDSATPVDLRLNVKILPMTITFSKPLVDKIIASFKPKKESKNLQKIGSVATKSFAILQRNAQRNLKFAMAHKKVFQVDMDFQAPRVIIPENCADPKCPAMVVDLGHFTLHTDTATSSNAEIDEQYFYDRFKLNLTGFTALVLPDRSVPLDLANTESVTQAALIERFDLAFVVELVNVNTPDIPKIKLFGKLPGLRVSVTREKIQAMMSVVKTITAKKKKPKANKPEKKKGGGIGNMFRHSKGRDKLIGLIDAGAVRRTPSNLGSPIASRKNAPGSPTVTKKTATPLKRTVSTDADSEDGGSSESESSDGSEGGAAVGDEDGTPKKLLDINFEISRLIFILNDTNLVNGEAQTLPLIVVDIKGLTMGLITTNLAADAKLQLLGLIVEDKLAERTYAKHLAIAPPKPDSPQIVGEKKKKDLSDLDAKLPSSGNLKVKPPKPTHWLVSSYGGKDDKQALINISLSLLDKRSAQYEDVGLIFNVTLGLLDAQINRPTIAAVLQVVSSIFKKKKKSPADSTNNTPSASPTIVALAADKLPSGLPITSGSSRETTSRGLGRVTSAISGAASSTFNISQTPNANDLLKLLKQRDAYVQHCYFNQIAKLDCISAAEEEQQKKQEDLKKRQQLLDAELARKEKDQAEAEAKKEAEAKAKAKSKAKIDVSRKKAQSEEETRRQVEKDVRGKLLLLRAKIKMNVLRIGLKKDGEIFFAIQLTNFMSNVDLRRNKTMRASGFLDNILVQQSLPPLAEVLASTKAETPKKVGSRQRREREKEKAAAEKAKDTPPEMKWSDLVTIKGQKAVEFSMEVFSPKLKDYPGYRLALSSKVGSLRFVLAARIIAELMRYFTGFTKMRKFLSRKSSKAPNPASSQNKGMKLDIEISNPMILIPRNSQDDDHLLADLGKIVISNTHVMDDIMKLEVMQIDITDMNIRSVITNRQQELKSRTFLKNVDASLWMKRPLARDPDHKNPDLFVNIQFSNTFTTEWSTDKLAFITGFLSGNISELPMRPDEAEFQMVMEILQSTNFEVFNRNSGKTAPPTERSNYVRFKIDLHIADLALTASAGNDADDEAKQLLKILGTNVGIKINIERDGSLILVADAEAVTVSDARPDAAANQFKTLFTETPVPNDTTTSSPLVSIKFESRPKERYQSSAIKLFRPQIFLIPGALADVFDFFLPFIRDMMRGINSFTKRRKIGSALDKKLKITMAEGTLKQHQFAEAQELMYIQTLEVASLVKQHHAQTADTLAKASNMNEKDLRLVKARLEKESEAVITSLKMKHLHKLKVLQQTHLEQIHKFRESQASLLTIINTRLSGIKGYTPVPIDIVIPASGIVLPQKKERKIRLMIQSPELYIMKDGDNSSESVAFVFHMGDSLVTVLQMVDKHKYDVKLYDLYAFKCTLNTQTLQAFDHILLLKPFNVEATVERARAQRLVTANVEVNTINTIISYKDLRVAIEVLRSFQPMLKAMRGTRKKEKERRIQIRAATAAAAAAGNAVAMLQTKPDDSKDSIPEQQATLRITNLEFSLLNDSNLDFITPLLKTDIDLIDNQIHLTKGKRKLSAMVEGLKMSAYNNDLAAYEPIIEPWNLAFVVKQELGKANSVELTADKTLNLNLTKSLVDTVFNARQFLQELTKKRRREKRDKKAHSSQITAAPASGAASVPIGTPIASPAPMRVAQLAAPRLLTSSLNDLSSEDSSETGSTSTSSNAASPTGMPSLLSATGLGRSFSPFIIQNQTFKKLRYWLSGASEDTAKWLEARSDAPIAIPTIAKEDVSKGDSKYELNLQLDYQDAPVFKNVPLDKVHKKGYTISVEKQLMVVSEVINKAGTKVLTIRTSKYIENRTNLRIEIQVQDDKNRYPHKAILEPQSIQSIPLEYFHYRTISIRPVQLTDADAQVHKGSTGEFSWFEWKAGQGSASVECQDSRNDMYWCCSLEYEEPISYGDATDPNFQCIYFKPSLLLENLLVSMMLFKMSSDRGREWDQSGHLDAGEEIALYYFKHYQPKLQCFAFQLGGYYWTAPVELAKLWDPKVTRPFQHTIEFTDTNNGSLTLFAEVMEPYKFALKISTYSKYWIVNQTGLPLQYRQNYRNQRFGEQDRRVVDLAADPRSWYAGKLTDFKASVAAQKFYYPHDEIQIQLCDSEWSPQMQLDAKKEDQPDSIVVNHAKAQRTWSFSHRIHTAPGRFWRTSEVRFFPSVILVNKTKLPLVYTQWEEDTTKTLSPFYEPKGPKFELRENEQIPFHWPNFRKEHFLTVNIKDHDSHWSGRFKIEQIDNFMIKIRQKQPVPRGDLPFTLVNVSIKTRKGITYVVFRPGEENFISLYEIDNQTNTDLIVAQKYVDPFDVIPRGKKISFFFDEPSLKKKITIRTHNLPIKLQYEFNFDKAEQATTDINETEQVQPEWDLRTVLKTKFKVHLLKKGYTETLLLYDELDTAHSAMLQSIIRTTQKEKLEVLEIDAKFASLAISLIDTTPQEVVYVTLQNVNLRVDKSGVEYAVQFSAQTGQVDNQLYRAPEPVAVYPIPSEDATQTAEQHAAIAPGASASFVKFEIHVDQREDKITHFNKIYFGLQPIEVNLDQIFILKLQTFLQYISKYIGRKIDVEALAMAKEEVLPLLKDKTLAEGDKFYFQNILLDNINAILSLRRGSNSSVSTVFKATSIKRILDNILAISSIERQNMLLAQCVIPSAFCSFSDFRQRIVKHYASASYSQLSGLLLNYVTRFGRSLFTTKRSVTPVRPPRFFPPDNLVVLFDLEKSYGQKLLRSIKGRVFLNDQYYFHYWLSSKCIIGSQNFLLMLDHVDGVQTIIWQETMREVIACLVEESTTIKVFILGLESQQKQAQERLIQCRSREQVEYISNKIDAIITKNKSEFSNTQTLGRREPAPGAATV